MYTAPEQFTIKAPGFEGPLDVLLDLIEKRKLLINDISLTQVADEYIKHVANLPELPLGQTADFVALAATLLLLKSRSLLPSLDLTEGEEHDVETLKLRLALHKLFREAALGLSDGKNYAYAPNFKAPSPIFAPHASMTASALVSALRDVLASVPSQVALPKTAVKTIVSLEEMIDRLTTRVQKQMKLSFKEFSGGNKAARIDIVVSFLALLELVKQGIIRAHQSEEHGDIILESDELGTPSYE